MTKKRIQFKDIVKNQLPQYVKEEYPLVGEFLKQYYLSQEFQGAPIDLIQNIDHYIKIDNISDLEDRTILGSDLDVTDTEIVVDLLNDETGTDGFPEKYGLILIDDEIISYEKKTFNGFLNCYRGFSGIISHKNNNSSSDLYSKDQLIFNDSEASEHKSGTVIYNLSSLFLKEFLVKAKYQLTPGFENRTFVEKINESLLIKQIKDFYASKGTDRSFEILFQALYGENVEIVRPKDYLFRPSDAKYKITNDLVVERISGPIEEIPNLTLFQDEYLNISKAYAPITDVEAILSSDGRTFYKLKVDAGYNRDPLFDGTTYGKFTVHAKTRTIGETVQNSTVLDVDSTVGFPNSGDFLVELEDGSSNIVSYKSKTLTQFLDCSGITFNIPDNSQININTFAYSTTANNDLIKVRITSVLSGLNLPEDNHYYSKNDTCLVRTLGFNKNNSKANNWIFNISTTYEVDSFELVDFSDQTYTINLKDEHIFKVGDIIDIINSSNEIKNSTIIDIISEKSIIVNGQGNLGEDYYKVKKKLLKANSSKYSSLSNISANVQNVYVDNDKILVSSPSIPYYGNQSLDVGNKSITFSGTFSGDTLKISSTFDHGFYNGDSVYYTPEKQEVETIDVDGNSEITTTIKSSLFSEGIYFVKRVDRNNIKLSRSKSDILNEKYISVDGTKYVENNKIELYEFYDKELQTQKVLREINPPIFTTEVNKTKPGCTGILVNGVEILNYKSKDKVIYGPIESIDVLSNGSNYDLINPPKISIVDSVGSGASCYCSISGSLSEIKVLDSGFDYQEIPVIKITGGNGTGAQASPNMSLVSHKVVFNSESLGGNVFIGGTLSSTIGFSTNHKFRVGEEVIYNTYSQRGVGGLSTNSTYYVSPVSDSAVKLHETLNDAVAGINTITLIDYGDGNHSLDSTNQKLILASVNVEDSGSGYENKKRTVSYSGISTSQNTITISNHDYKSGEIVRYFTEGTPIGGLTNNNDYYVTKVNENTFRLSEIGVGDYQADFYYRTNEFVNITSKNNDLHVFNYPDIKVEVIGNVGISSSYKAQVQPIFRGEITSVHVISGGSSYGVENVFNLDRQPDINVEIGSGAEFSPVISNGQIKQVLVNSVGTKYKSIPDIIVLGEGTGAVLAPVILNEQIVDVKVIQGGFGYSSNSTNVIAIYPGTGAKFKVNIKSWTVNLFEKYLSNVTEDDGFLTPSLNDEYGLQYCHLYAPRKLREILYSSDQSGRVLYSNQDLRRNNAIEINSTDHSPIIGWSYDGHPIYGPYGYSKKFGGIVSQMKSGYRLSIKSGRPPLDYYPEGFFIEDYEYFTSDDDTVLDKNNGRFCITPEFPNGTYAYFATLNQIVESDGPFTKYKKPVFPYLIGENYNSSPNQFNFNKSSNQDEIDLRESNWIRNTYSYNLTNQKSSYDYVSLPNKLNQSIDVVGVSPGIIDRIGILTGGDNYKVNDPLIFNNLDSNNKVRGNSLSATVSVLVGKAVTSVSVATTNLYDVEIYPGKNKGEFLTFNEVPHNLNNFDLVSITGVNTTSSLIEGEYIVGISSLKLALSGLANTTIGLKTVGNTGIVTYISVLGNLDFYSVRENDIFTLNSEKVKILNVDQKSSRLRILRQVDNTVGVSHSITSILYENPRKLSIISDANKDYSTRINKEFYFDPKETLAIGSVGVGTTIYFSNPGVGVTEIFVPIRSIYLPNHQLNTGDVLTYKTNGGSSISVSNTGTGSFNLQNNSSLYVAKISEDLIGISTVKVGLGSTGFFAGITNSTKNIGLLYFVGLGTGNYHSFKTNHSVLTAQLSKNTVTVSTAQTHGLSNNDTIEMDIDPLISTPIKIKYNDHNRRLIVDSKDFTSGDVDTSSNSITIPNHKFRSGDKVIHTSTSPSGGLVNNGIYYIIFVDNNTVKLSNTYFDSKNILPTPVEITSSSLGSLSSVNPPISGYRKSKLTFDLSDSSLSYTYQSIQYPAFRFELYKDSEFRNIFDSTEESRFFNVERVGSVGVTTNASVTLDITESIPKTLYYKLIPILDENVPVEKKEIIEDNLVLSNNEVQIKDSFYNGKHKILVRTDKTFTYPLRTYPESQSYSSEFSNLKYYTDSLSAYGPIKDVKIINKGLDYYSLPLVSGVKSGVGTGSILECYSDNIGKIKKTRINDIGFEFPSDYTLRPNISLPKVIKIDRLYSIDNIGITSFGRGYVSPAKLLVFDGRTKELIPEVDLSYNLGQNSVLIKNNTYRLSNVSPTILPFNNSNGVGIRTVSYNSSTKKVTVGLSTGFSSSSSFPFNLNDRVLIENVSIGIGSTGKGFNSENYNYQLFTLTDIDANIGGKGSVSYSLEGLLGDSEFPGNFNIANSSAARIIPEKFFPQFTVSLKKNEYKKGEIVQSKNSTGIVENWDSVTDYLKIETKNIFNTGDLITGLTSKTQGLASSVTDFDCYAILDSTSKVESGWQSNAGFLNDDLQKIQDSLYYQNFSYSIRSRVDYDTWNDAVSSLNHTVGFKKFSDLQLESKLSQDNNSLRVGILTDTTKVDTTIDIIGFANLNCVFDFDLAKENSINLDSRILSDKIYFSSRILTDYFESVGNRVLSIDDFSSEFNSNPRPTKYVDINRFNVRDVRAQKYFAYIRDRRFVSQRQSTLLTLLHDNFIAYLNQYGRVETSYDLGSFDFAIEGTEGVLQFYPTKFKVNDYQIAVYSFNLKDDLTGVGTIFIESAAKIDTNTLTFSNPQQTIVSFATTYRSSKILVQVGGSDGEFEFNELNIIHNGIDVEMLEYGQLSTKSTSPFSSVGYGTYYAYISGSEVKVDFIPDPIAIINDEFFTVNTFNVFLYDSSSSGSDFIDMKHARIEARTTNILSSPTPSESVILDYSGEYATAYCIVQVSDLTNGRYNLSEVVMVSDDILNETYTTEFAYVETDTSLGVISSSITGGVSQLIFTPIADIDIEVKVYANVLRLQDDFKDVIELNYGTLETNYATYFGTENDIRRSFELTHKSYPIFERVFSAEDQTIINTLTNTIEVPGHFFVTGEKLEYTNTGAGTTNAIGIALTTVPGIGLTSKLPPTVYAVKVNDNKIKLASTAENALKTIPQTLQLTSVGIGSLHKLTCYNQNSRVLVSLDNIIQSPIVATAQTTSLAKYAYSTDDIIYFTGITSFFGGDLIKIGDEIMKINSVGVGSTNAINVIRPWMGTVVAGYSTYSLVTKVTGNYNIVGNVINFVEAPYGLIPLSSTANAPDERDWDNISVTSKFSGRVFMRSGISNSSNDVYYKNYIFDDISNQFTGTDNTFTLKSLKSDVTDISTENAIILVNDVFQGPGVSQNYTLSENSGITSITFTGAATSAPYDVNSSNLPTGGIIVSVGSTEGFGYQPLVSAGGTAIISGLGTVSSISIANSGSGYRQGIQNVRVGVQTYDNNGFYLKFIGTAAVSNGSVVSVAITNPGFGYTSSNPPKVVIDAPLSYSDIPLIYSSESQSGLGTAATVDIVVGQGSSVIEFEIKNTGYGYREGEILTVQSGGTLGIPTTSGFSEFKLSVQTVSYDKFTGWSVGELQTFDDISDLFDGETTTFPLSVAGNPVSIKSKKGSSINVQDLLLVFINDILQVPGEGYIFEGGSIITFTEAPKGPVLSIPGTNDKCKIIFYKGTGSIDVIERNILETVKVGDGLVFGYDASIGQQSTLQEDERTVNSILTVDSVTTNPYFGPGNVEDESLVRTISWCRQTEDKIINEKEVNKNRMLYEPIVTPVAYAIDSLGIGGTIVYVDTIRPFFNPTNENNVSLSFQKNITIISQDEKVSAAATAIISPDGKLSELTITEGGSGYDFVPQVSIQVPNDLNSSIKAQAYSVVNLGSVEQLIITNVGLGYSQENPPVVLIESPKLQAETNPVSSYQGDSGVIVGFGTTTIGFSDQIILDFYIPRDSYLRDLSVVGSSTTISGISTGDFFIVYESNVGLATNPIRSIRKDDSILGITTQFIDMVYQVDSSRIVRTNVSGIGLTYVNRVFAKVSGLGTVNFSSSAITFDSTIYTFDNSGLTTSNYTGGISTSYNFGKYSWGKIVLSSRSNEYSFNSYNNNGVIGIQTSFIVKRTNPLKYSNYVI